jgi:hypothetical protein
MKNILLILLITVISLLMVLPKIIGTQVKAHYLTLWQQLANQSGYEVDHGEFKSSWFSSSGTSVISIPIDAVKDELIKIDLNTKISHGPLLFENPHSLVGLMAGEISFSMQSGSKEISQLIDNLQVTESPLAVVHVGLTGVMTLGFSVKEFSFSAQDVQVRSEGISSQWRSNKELSAFIGKITVNPMSISSRAFNLEIDTLSSNFNTSQYNGLNVLGSQNLSLAGIDFRSPTGNASVSDVELSYSGIEQNNRINSQFEISIAKLLVPAPINSVSYSAELLQVDPEFYLQWVNLSQQQSQDPVLLKQQAMDLATLLLKPDTALHQTLRLQGMGGHLDATARVEYQSSSDSSATTIDNLADLLALLHITASVAVDKVAIDQTGMTPILGYYLEQDLIGLKNDRYQVEVALDKGSLNINQKPAPEEIASQINLMLTGNPQQRNTAESVTEPPQTKVETSDSSPSTTSDEESDKATAEADGQSITDANEGDQNNTKQGGEQ